MERLWVFARASKSALSLESFPNPPNIPCFRGASFPKPPNIAGFRGALGDSVIETSFGVHKATGRSILVSRMMFG